MHLIAVLGLIAAISAVVALVQEGKDRTVGLLAGAMAIVGVAVALSFHVSLVANLLPPPYSLQFRVVAALAAVLGIVLVVRLRNRVVGTLLVTSSLLIAGRAFVLLT